jgi:chromosome segregation ATPase
MNDVERKMREARPSETDKLKFKIEQLNAEIGVLKKTVYADAFEAMAFEAEIERLKAEVAILKIAATEATDGWENAKGDNERLQAEVRELKAALVRSPKLDGQALINARVLTNTIG